MAWYRTGTISVTNGSATVTGSGTAFVENVRAGYGLVAPDGRTYEIAAVVSDTQLTLAAMYLGSNASGQSYAIFPTQSVIADLATQAAELLDSFALVRDGVGAGLHPDGSVSVPAIRFSADQDTGIYRIAANQLAVVAAGNLVSQFTEDGLITITGTFTKTSAVADTIPVVVQNANDTAGTSVSLGFSPHSGTAIVGKIRCLIDGADHYSLGFFTYNAGLSEQVRITYDGSVGVGTTTPVGASGRVLEVYNGGGQSRLALKNFATGSGSTDGLQIFVDGSGGTGIANYENSPLDVYTNGSLRLRIEAAGGFRPGADNGQALGDASFRWSTVYAGTGTINTSDERDKAWRGELTDQEYAAGLLVLDQLGLYQWTDAIAEKGADGARYHFGVRAQRIWAIFAAAGLVSPLDDQDLPGETPYGFLCFDEWDELTQPVLDEDGEPTGEVTIVREAGNRFGIRPDELALFLVAVQARRQSEIEARLAAMTITTP